MSNKPQSPTSCGRRPPRAGETPLAALAPDGFEMTVLAIIRHLFTSFANPAGHGWLKAVTIAECALASEAPGALFLDIVRVVQGVRLSRRSTLAFSNPECVCCAAVLTEPERHLMQAMMAVRRGHIGIARTHAMLLCEGGDIEPLILALNALPKPSKIAEAVC